MPTRRTLLLAGVSVAAVTAAAMLARPRGRPSDGTFEINRSETEWRRLLSPDQFAVLREEATERPGSSPLNGEKRAGLYNCAGCDLAVYDGSAKYDSGTGWPSFRAAVAGAVAFRPDNKLLTQRTEVHCRRCGGHLGHVFDDGPEPAGKRHCLNGVALHFVAAAAAG